MFKTIQIGIVMLACAFVAAAQSSDYRKYEFYAGYSFGQVVNGIGDAGLPDDPQDYSGLNTSITRNIARYAGLKFDFSVTEKIPYATRPSGLNVDSDFYNFSVGLQIKDNSSDKLVKPFLHALMGVAHIRNRISIGTDACIASRPCPTAFTERETGIASIVGGGIDIRAGDRIDVRVIQVDYIPTRLFDSSKRNVRVGIGLAFH